MYKCLECERIFDEPKIYSEDCTPYGQFEGGYFINRFSGCPYCEGTNFEEIQECCQCEFFGIVKNGTYTKDGFVCEECSGVEEDEQ